MLFRSDPTLDLLLTSDRCANVTTGLVKHQTIDVVLSAESRHNFAAMLEDPPLKVVRDTCVQGSRGAGHDVHAVRLQASLFSVWVALNVMDIVLSDYL